MTRTLSLLPLLALAACGGESLDSPASETEPRVGVPTQLPVLTVGELLLEIGEFEGGGEQTLDLVSDVAPVGEDGLVVVDRGAASVLTFDRAGRRLAVLGGRGDGPGEFRAPGVTLVRGDTLLVTDEGDRTVSRILSDGTYIDELSGVELNGDDRFPLDALMSGRLIIEGVLDPSMRAQTLAATSGLTFPMDRAGFRTARVSGEGGLWVRELTGGATEPAVWVRLSERAIPMDAVELPARFEPMWLGADEVIGRWRDEFDVHYVRSYALAPSGRTMDTPTWMTVTSSATPVAGPERDSMYFAMKMSAKDVATAQEIHYAEHGTYTNDLAAAMAEADIVLPAGIEAVALDADSRGHRVVLSAAGFDAICALAMGYTSFSGVYAGSIVCGDEGDATRWDKPDFGAGKGDWDGKGKG